MSIPYLLFLAILRWPPVMTNLELSQELARLVKENASVNVPPHPPGPKKITIHVDMSINLLNNVDITRQKIDATVVFVAKWSSLYVSWEPSDYGGTFYLELDLDDAWYPKILFSNDVNGDSQLAQSKATIGVYWYGDMTLGPYFRGFFQCAMDAKYFPFDEHDCCLEVSEKTIGLYTFETNETFIADIDDSYSLWSRGPKWVVNSDRKDHVKFCYMIQRNSAFYMANTVIPSILINYLGGCTFLIPCESGEKSGFGVAVFLAQTVSLMSISQYVPEGGKELPVFQKYLLVSILFFVIILLVNIFLTTMAQTKRPESTVSSKPWKFILEKVSPLIYTGRWARLQRDDLEETPDIPKEDPKNNSLKENVSTVDSKHSVLSESEQDYRERVSEELEIVCETINLFLLILSFSAITLCTGIMLAVVIIQ